MITVSKWICNEPGCKNETIVGGRSGLALLFVGWGTDLNETKTYCPRHHPLGEEQVKLQLAAAVLFLRFINQVNAPDGEAKILELLRLAGIEVPSI